LPSESSATDTGQPRELVDGSRVAVVGGGPAGSFFSFFLLQLSARMGIDLKVDIYEPRNFDGIGPKSCNMCGGIVSESLVQNLAAEGVRLPATVVQRTLHSYFLHTDVGGVQIATPAGERRIAAVHRGCGPRGTKDVMVRSFDSYLLEQALNEGARRVTARVSSIGRKAGRLYLQTGGLEEETYDLVAVATGINAPGIKFLDGVIPEYQPPGNTKTYICEPCFFGRDNVKRYLGSSMHVFLLNIPRLEFAAIIPKGEYATICLLGEEIDKEMVQSFMNAPEVRPCFPPGWQQAADFCHCSPRINVRPARHPFADGVVFVGDCGTTRLYKDGIGAAYRTAKAAARTAVFYGIRKEDFERQYQPACKAIARDNNLGKIVFAVTRIVQRYAFLRRGLCRRVTAEQGNGGSQPLSKILWNTFTGSAPYRDILLCGLQPSFLLAFAWNILAANMAALRRIR
jgi:flavin-dependent dehydrogenase